LDAAESLRKEQLKQVGALRREVYALARKRGVSSAMLRVARKLMK
jgi:hypothetical protein